MTNNEFGPVSREIRSTRTEQVSGVLTLAIALSASLLYLMLLVRVQSERTGQPRSGAASDGGLAATLRQCD